MQKITSVAVFKQQPKSSSIRVLKAKETKEIRLIDLQPSEAKTHYSLSLKSLLQQIGSKKRTSKAKALGNRSLNESQMPFSVRTTLLLDREIFD